MGRPTVVIDLDARLARDLDAGGAFVACCTLPLDAECELVVRCDAEEVRVAARVVYVAPSGGAGLELTGLNSEIREQLTKLLGREVRTARASEPSVDGTATPSGAGAACDVPTVPFERVDPAEPAESDEPAAGRADDEGKPEGSRNAHERLRGLTLAEQVKLATTGDQTERVLLERFYGKNVWEPLLRNPRLTAPEVARIARMGALPRVLLEVILNNGAWLQIAEVRRALLSNPRLGTDQIIRLLRLMPKHELKLAAVQTAYPAPVRDAAKRLIRDG
ncbi:MAG: hypothetical protein AB7P03_16125 [Kofleriaceae bacterium]